jgi:putative ATP-binding cassette transporter
LDSLSVTFPAGTRTLVTGSNEAGRIALFRASAGLWDAGEGRIVHPPPEDFLFLMERPYLPPGTLREALVRTGREAQVGEARIREVLRALGLEAVIERSGGLDIERDWNRALSLGEQQLLSFARLVLAGPRYALLDRPGTVLDDDAVGRALDLLREQSISVVTFARDEALAARHDGRLDLISDGKWTWLPPRARQGLAEGAPPTVSGAPR